MIDAHQHFWQLSRGDYAWIDDTVAPIRRDYLPKDLIPLMRAAGVTGTILVQATDTLEETDYMLHLGAQYDFIQGVVGWVDFSSPTASLSIDRQRRNPLLKGLRPMLQSIEDSEWILRPDVQGAITHLLDCDLRFDALIQPRHLGAIIRLAHAYPDLPIVIDHLAKPKMGGGSKPDEDWVDGMRLLGRLPNVWCKFSGMVTEIGPNWQISDLKPFADLILDSFTPERVMWGSDWPVLNLAGDYLRWVDTARDLTAHLSAREQAHIFSGAARAFYGLDAG